MRSLERELGRLARKVAAKVASGAGAAGPRPEHLADWLGRAKVVDDVPERTELPGVATGLAVTGDGGDVLFIETTAFPTAADGRARADPHRPARRRDEGVGADRAELRAVARRRARASTRRASSAASTSTCRPARCPRTARRPAITMTTALVSLLRDQPVKDTVGMTGEITLQGAVLPIGGVKQKVLAAHRAGLREVVLPKRNAADLDDVPEAVRDEMTFHLADTYADVLAAAFAA